MPNLACGCTPDASGYGHCSACKRKLNEQIWRNMSEEKRQYDRTFDPGPSRKLDSKVLGHNDFEYGQKDQEGDGVLEDAAIEMGLDPNYYNWKD